MRQTRRGFLGAIAVLASASVLNVRPASSSAVDPVAEGRAEGYRRGYDVATARAESRARDGGLQV